MVLSLCQLHQTEMFENKQKLTTELALVLQEKKGRQ